MKKKKMGKDLKKMITFNFKRKLIYSYTFLLVLFCLLPLTLSASLASLHLQIISPEIPSLTIYLKGESLYIPLISQPDSHGYLSFMGLSPGVYELIIMVSSQKEWVEPIFLEPAQRLHIKISWPKGERQPTIEQFDLSDLGAQTVISQKQISLLPSADNFSSVIENQDFSATTNRLDSGGLWADSPALFSSRGGTSWTQNEFRLNGLNITEPYFGGTPLLYLDLITIETWRHRHAFLPASAPSPGGLIELASKKSQPVFRSAILFSLIEPWLTTSNINSSLVREGLTESHKFHHDRKFRFWACGPFGSKNLPFFLSILAHEIGRNIADYNGHNQARLYSGTFRLTQDLTSGQISLFLVGQQSTEEEFGAQRKIQPEATLKAKRYSFLSQIFWQSKPASKQAFFGGFSLAYQNFSTSPYHNNQSIPCREIFRPLFWHAPLNYGQEKKGHANLRFQGELFVGSLASSYHLWTFGQDFSFRFFQATHKIPHLTHLLFLEGKPALVAIFAPPTKETEKAIDWSLFLQDTWSFSSTLIFEMGFNLLISKGKGGSSKIKRSFNNFVQARASEISWINLLPRFSLTFPFAHGRKGHLKFFFGRMAYFLPLNYLRWGNPEAEGCLIYRWDDKNADAQFDQGELGLLLRREGPFFARLDPQIKRPMTNEFGFSLIYRLSQEFFLSLSGFTRLTWNLIETENIGVKDADYEKLVIEDIGDDQIPGTHDDHLFIIYNRLPHALGKDLYLLTNPDAVHRTSRYRGLDFLILRRFSHHIFYFSFTATEAFGTTSPGNTEWENDDALIGWLYDDPNSLINARGRLRFDRAYTARLGFTFNLPYNFKMGFIAKYYDGQPFTRKIVVSHLNQGPIFIQAFPRGIARYEFNMTVDFRVEKTLSLSLFHASLFLEGYNLLNQSLATQENEWTSPEFPLRFATEIQSPRVFRIGLKLEF